MKKRSSLFLFFVFYTIHYTGSNFVHPVTPAMFSNLGFPSYMFGVAFASLAATSFLFSPFWGKLSDMMGRISTMAISGAGYALSQYLFGMATTIPSVIVARLICGFFGGGFLVVTMAYVADCSTPETVGQNMTIYAAITSICNAAGYFIGGVIGDYSIKLVFICQTSLLLVNAVVCYFCVGEVEGFSRTERFDRKAMNPFRAFIDAREVLTKPLVTFLVAVFVTTFATQAYDQVFNYYLRDAFQFPPSYNGMIKAVTGIIGLIANLTINVWIARKTDGRKSIVTVLGLCAVSLLISIYIPDIKMYIMANIIFYTFNAMYLPILQALMVEDDSGSNGVTSGLFNTVRSLGMIAGPLLAGFAYDMNKMSPFMAAAIAFFLGTGICLLNYYQYKNKKNKQKEKIVLK